MALAHVGLDAAAKPHSTGTGVITASSGLVSNGARRTGTHGSALTWPLMSTLVFAVAVKALAVRYARRAVGKVQGWLFDGRIRCGVHAWIRRGIHGLRIGRRVCPGVASLRIATPVSGVRVIKIGPFTATDQSANCQQPDDSHPLRMNDASGSRQGDAKPLESLAQRGIY